MSKPAASLPDRTAALEQAATLARGRLPDHDVDRALEVATKVRARLGHGTEHTLVALAGPTGAGKSTIFNELAGRQLSRPGVRRPTTSEVHACSWGDAPDNLLDWLGVRSRHHLDPGADPSLAGLVLLDLPDFDSTATDHKATVDRLVELVDLLVWVTDPQKYADASLHHGYLVPFANHGSIMRFVLNKVDTVAPADIVPLVDDFEHRVELDGIADAVVIPASHLDGGLSELRSELEKAVTEKRASLSRLDADLVEAGRLLATPARSNGITRKGRRQLVASLAEAAGSEHVSRIAAEQHRRDGRRAMASPPMRWFARRSRQPVASLPRVAQSPVHAVAVAAALRDVAEDADGSDAVTPWSGALRHTLQEQQAVVTRRIAEATGSAARQGRAPRWWTLVASVQRLLAGAAAVGFTWLLVVAVVGGFFALDTDPLLIATPGADWIPVPSLLALGGVAGALLTSLLTRLPLAVGARRRARRARAAMAASIEAIVDENVISVVEDLQADRDEISRLLEIVSIPFEL